MKSKKPKKPHPWRDGPSVQKHISESRQVERTHENVKRTYAFSRTKRKP
jgi:hypothetical protein